MSAAPANVAIPMQRTSVATPVARVSLIDMILLELKSPAPATHVKCTLRRFPMSGMMPREAPRVHTKPSMPLPAGDHAVFPARLGALPETATFARDFCERNGVSRGDALRLTLI